MPQAFALENSYNSVLLHIYEDARSRDWSFGRSDVPPAVVIKSFTRLDFLNSAWKIDGVLSVPNGEVTFNYQIRYYSANYYVRSINATIPGPAKNTNYQVALTDYLYPTGQRNTITSKILFDHRQKEYLNGTSKKVFSSRLTQVYNSNGILTQQSATLTSNAYDKSSNLTYSISNGGEVLSTEVKQNRWGKVLNITNLISGAESGEVLPDNLGEGLLGLDDAVTQYYPIEQIETCQGTSNISLCKNMVSLLSNNGKGYVSYHVASGNEARAATKEAGITIGVSGEYGDGLDASKGFSIGLSLQPGGALQMKALEVQLNDTSDKKGRFLISSLNTNLTTYVLRARDLKSADSGFNISSIKSVAVLAHSAGIMSTMPVTGSGWAIIGVLISPYSFSTAADGDVVTNQGVPIQFELIKEDGTPYVFESVQSLPVARNGLLQIAPNMQTLTYTPNSNFKGKESFPLTNTCISPAGVLSHCSPGYLSIRVDADPFSSSLSEAVNATAQQKQVQQAQSQQKQILQAQSQQFQQKQGQQSQVQQNQVQGPQSDQDDQEVAALNGFPNGPVIINDLEITRFAITSADITSDAFNANEIDFGDSATFPVKGGLPVTGQVGAKGVINSLATVPVTGKATVTIEFKNGRKTFTVSVTLNGKDEQETTSGNRTISVQIFRNITFELNHLGALVRTDGGGSGTLNELLTYKKGYKQNHTETSGKKSITVGMDGLLYGLEVGSVYVDKNIKEKTNSTGKEVDTSWQTTALQMDIDYVDGESTGIYNGFERIDYRGPNPGVSLALGTPQVDMLGESFTFQRFEKTLQPTVDENKGSAFLFRKDPANPYSARVGRAVSGNLATKEIDATGKIIKDDSDGGLETKYETYVVPAKNTYDNQRRVSNSVLDPAKNSLSTTYNHSYTLGTSWYYDSTYDFTLESASISITTDQIVGGEVIRNFRSASGGRDPQYGTSDRVTYDTKIYDLNGIGLNDTGGPKFDTSFSRDTEFSYSGRPRSISGYYSFRQDGEVMDQKCISYGWGAPPSGEYVIFGSAYPPFPYPTEPSHMNARIGEIQSKQGSAGDGIQVFVPNRYPRVPDDYYHQFSGGNACGFI